jgi:hypothetical protein
MNGFIKKCNALVDRKDLAVVPCLQATYGQLQFMANDSVCNVKAVLDKKDAAKLFDADRTNFQPECILTDP